MNGNYLVDTNIVIALFANEPGIENCFNQSKRIHLPVVVLGELIYGAKYSRKPEENFCRIQEFRNECECQWIDQETATQYAEIKLQLRQKGRPIPDNDIWIAAIAQQHQLILVTRDSHFNEIEDLMIERW